MTPSSVAELELTIPAMGGAIEEATVTRWLVEPGQTVVAGEPIVAIASPLLDVTVPAPVGGVVSALLLEAGQTAAAGAALARITSDEGAATPTPPASPRSADAPPPAARHRARVTPVARRAADHHGIDIAAVRSEQGGDIRKADVLAFVEGAAYEQPEPTDSSVVKLTPMRRRIAERVRQSVDASPHVTAVFEVDLSRVLALRDAFRDDIRTRYGAKVTPLPFIARALASAAADWPWMNAELREKEVVLHRAFHLGVAVALDRGGGLVVPVIRHAERQSVGELARAVTDLAGRARSGDLGLDEVRGGTFTLTNPGAFGAVIATPIINQPQVAIVDMEAIVHRVVAIPDGGGGYTIGVRPMMNLCISYDHRLIDGVYGAGFMSQVKRSLEEWGSADYGL